MSKKTQTVGSDATPETMKEFLTASDKPATTAAPEKQPAKKQRNIAYRLFALLLAVAPIVVYLLLPVEIFITNEAGALALYHDGKLLDIFINLFTGGSLAYTTLFGIVPITTTTSMFGIVTNAIMYLIPVAMLVTVIAAIIALFSGKKARGIAKFIAFINFWLYFGYELSLVLISGCAGMDMFAAIDIAELVIAGACLALYLILSLITVGKRAWGGLIYFLLTVVATGAIVYPIVMHTGDLAVLFVENELYKWILLGMIGGYAISLLFSFGGISAKKLYGADIVRVVFTMLLGGAFIYGALTIEQLGQEYLFWGIVSTAAAFVMLIVEILVLSIKLKKKAANETETVEEPVVEEAQAEAAVEQPVVEPVAEPVVEEAQAEAVVEQPVIEPVVEAVAEEEVVEEEIVEAIPIEEAEEVIEPAPAATETAETNNGFDSFLITLSAEERTQFTQLFILKYRGEMSELPDYQVGGDNTMFFRKIFVNLGSLRARIPDGLMDKIYQFTIRQ